MPEQTDELICPKEAAKMLKVSVGYLRNSDCPKVLLPTQGSRSIVRYWKSELLRWANQWRVAA